MRHNTIHVNRKRKSQDPRNNASVIVKTTDLTCSQLGSVASSQLFKIRQQSAQVKSNLQPRRFGRQFEADGKSDNSPRVPKPSLARHQVKANSEFRRRMVNGSDPYRLQNEQATRIFGGLNSDESFHLDQSQLADKDHQQAYSVASAPKIVRNPRAVHKSTFSRPKLQPK